MSYKVKIVRVEVVEETATREWRQLRTDGQQDPLGKGETYGYVEPASPTVRRTREAEVLTQEVADLDLAAVIRAVNNL